MVSEILKLKNLLEGVPFTCCSGALHLEAVRTARFVTRLTAPGSISDVERPA